MTLSDCPFCGSKVTFSEVISGRDKGGVFIACTEATCEMTTKLMFACGEDPKPQLAEMWNRRPVSELGGSELVEKLRASLFHLEVFAETDGDLGRVRGMLATLDEMVSEVARHAQHMKDFAHNILRIQGNDVARVMRNRSDKILEIVKERRDVETV